MKPQAGRKYMERIRAAVIGTGFIGPAHIEALKRIGGVDVVAVASVEPDKAKEIADEFSISKVYSDWTEVVADGDVQVIHNCTPNNLHYQVNRAAIVAGKHIVSEKPLTLNSRESAELVRLAKAKGVVNAIDFNYRFYPLIQQAREMVRRGELGKIFLVHGHYLQDWLFYETDWNWRVDAKVGGASRAVADIGSHWCDLTQFVTGLRVESVFAELVTVHKRRTKPAHAIETFRERNSGSDGRSKQVAVNTEDMGIVILKFDNGTRGVFTVSQVSAGRKNYQSFEIDGSAKSISWNQEEPNQMWVGYREKANEILLKDPSLMNSGARKYAHYPGGHPEGYPDGLKNFLGNVYEFIRSKRNPVKERPEFPTFEDGHFEMKLVEAVLKSNKTKKWVSV